MLCACLLQSASLLQFLLDSGASTKYPLFSGIPLPMFFSLMAPSSSCLHELLKRGVANTSLTQLGDRKRNLLHVLCTMGKPRHFEEVALFLLSKGVSIHSQDEDGGCWGRC